MRSKILLFRAPSDKGSKNADSYVELLGQNRITAISVPVLEYQFVNLGDLAEKLCQPNLYSGLVLTSPRSVEAVSSCRSKHQINISPWTQLDTYVVGEATGQLALEKLQLTAKGQESGNAAALAQQIISDDLLNQNKPLLFPSADIKLDTLPSTLKAAGILLDSITVYETKVRADLASSLQEILLSSTCKPEAFVFFSPSGVAGVFDALNTLSIPITDYKLFAIGPSTGEALKARNLKVAGTASKPNAQCLLEALRNGGIVEKKS